MYKVKMVRDRPRRLYIVLQFKSEKWVNMAKFGVDSTRLTPKGARKVAQRSRATRVFADRYI